MIYSVCVVHYGDFELTRDCLRSVESLELAPRGRFLLWNDPGLPPLGEGLLDGWQLIVPGGNLGFGGGANRAIREALRDSSVEAVLLLNNDATIEPDATLHLTAALVGQPSLGMVGPRILQSGTELVWHDGGDIRWPQGKIRSRGYGEPEADRAELVPAEVDFVCGCAPLIRARAFEDTEGFDERYFLYYEDVDLGVRLRGRGWGMLHVPRARVWHHGSAGVQREGQPFSRYYRLRNRLLFCQDHGTKLARWGSVLSAHLAGWWRAARYGVSGRADEAGALLAALSDARSGRWGRSQRFESHASGKEAP